MHKFRVAVTAYILLLYFCAGGRRRNMRFSRLPEAVFVLILCGVISCSATKQKNDTLTTIPISEISAHPIGEQNEIVQAYGLPDSAYKLKMGITTWIYCSQSKTPVHIQFDRGGAVLNRFYFPKPNCRSIQIKPVSH